MVSLQNNGDAEVKITQQGDLTITQTIKTPSGTGAISDDYVVPAGKKWVLKAVELGRNSFTGTITSSEYRIYPLGSINPNILFKNVSSPDYFTDIIGTQDIVLSSGAMVRCTRNISAYTSGDVKSLLMYVEFNA